MLAASPCGENHRPAAADGRGEFRTPAPSTGPANLPCSKEHVNGYGQNVGCSGTIQLNRLERLQAHAAWPWKTQMTSVEKIVWNIFAAPRRSIAPWYGAYTLLGVLSSGLIPVLIPLMMVAISKHLSTVGYVMGAFNLGSLASPMLGSLAESKRLYRPIFFAGFVFLMAAIGLFPLVHHLRFWLPLALIAGIASTAVSTCATLFIVEFEPREEWTARIGWLQTFNGVGQVIGLVLAGVFAATNIPVGLWIGAGLMIPAVLLGGFGLPKKSELGGAGNGAARLHLDFATLARFSRVELLGGGMLRFFHPLNAEGLKNIRTLLPTRFGRLMLAVFCMFFGVSGVFAYFPIFLRHSFGVLPAATSLAYAVAAGAAIIFYTLGGRLANRFGAVHVYSGGLLLRLIGFLGLVALAVLDRGPLSATLALLFFGVIVMAWPIISVTTTELASELSPISQGAAQGLYNSTSAIATVIGTPTAGALVRFFGYPSIPIMGVAGVLLSLLISLGLRRKGSAVAASASRG